jgi:multiple sugar transport system permease protein
MDAKITQAPHRVIQVQSGSSLWKRLRQAHFLNYLLLIAGAFVMILPFVWMVSTSFKPQSETISFPPRLLPINPTLDNYINVFQRLNIERLYLNTAFVAVTKTIINVYTSSLIGYIFGKFTFRGRDILFYTILATWIIPFEVYMIPLYVMMVKAGLGNSYWALILPEISSAYAIFLFRQFMFTIPNDLLDAGRIDGAGEWYIFHRLILPLSRPVVATLVAFYFMWNWNDFLWPLIVISSPEKYVLPVGLAVFVNDVGTQYGVTMAGATLAIVPVLIIFLLMQRHIIQGITLTGLK